LEKCLRLPFKQWRSQFFIKSQINSIYAVSIYLF
jgi:hypothetical protein